jgi:Spy/CpxP family protein refolding chaperone
MWGVAKPLLVLLSVVLNGAFVAAWLSQTVSAEHARKRGCEDGVALLRKIGVTDAQLREIEPRLAAFRKACRARCQEINRLRRELLDLLAAPEPDQAAIRTKQNEILEGQRQMEELVVKQLLDERTLLTPPQRKALFDLIRARCGCAGPAADCDAGCGLDCGNRLQDGPGDCRSKTLPQRSS